MNQPDYTYNDPWETGVYGTGRTNPPRNNGSGYALLLVLVIFLLGIVTLLGILNIRLFQKLNQQDQQDLSISFTPETIEVTEPPVTEIIVAEEAEIPMVCNEESLSLRLEESPASVDNIPQAGGMALQDIYVKNIPSVVSIICSGSRSSSTGTGVILTDDGYVVTNAHVIDGAVSVSVRLTDDREFQASLVGSDEVSDLAVLRIEASDLIPATFGDSEILRVGDSVVAIGDPLGVDLRGTYTNGIISAINRDVAVNGRTMTLIQTNAALNSGNSGGPLINCYGQVIGINTMKIGAFTDSAGVEGIGFAIPSATVKDIVDQIISQGYVSGRPTLGISGESLSSLYQHFYHLPAGLYITDVAYNSPAWVCGIEEGDILLSIDNSRITDMDSLKNVLYTHEAGDQVTVTIYRNGNTASATVILAEDKG